MKRRIFWIFTVSRTARWFGYAVWVLLASLVIILFWISLNACSFAGIFPGIGREFCTADTSFDVSEESLQRDRQTMLLREIEQLEQAIALSPECQSTVLGELNCPPPNPDEILLVMDSSTSMENCARPPVENIARIRELYDEAYLALEDGDIPQARTLRQQAINLETAVSCLEPNRRIDSAASAIETFTQQTLSAERIVLTTLGECTAPLDVLGTYDPRGASSMRSELDGLDLVSVTALAATIEALPDQIEGGETPDEPVSVILISDGEDTCDMTNPCAAAQAFNEAKPYAVINVITIGGDPYVGLCIAEATGGNVYDGRDASVLPLALRQASGQTRPAGCE